VRAAAACCRYSLADGVRRRCNMQGMRLAGACICSGSSRPVRYQNQIVHRLGASTFPVLKGSSVHGSPDRVCRRGCVRSCLQGCKARFRPAAASWICEHHVVGSPLISIDTDRCSRARPCLLSRAARRPALSCTDCIRSGVGSHCKGLPNSQVKAGYSFLVLGITCRAACAIIWRLQLGGTHGCAVRGVTGGVCRKAALLQCDSNACVLVPCKQGEW
jgi:hypothetical protein